MKTIYIHLLIFGLLQFYSPFVSEKQPVLIALQAPGTWPAPDPDLKLKQAVFEILKTKCNVCHRKKNPFRVFSLKNMDKNAKRIYKQVFVFQRMPKGDKVKLTDEDLETLKHWLKSKNTF